MKNFYTSVNHNELNPRMANIVAMNMIDPEDEDAEDYDFDYDPNDLYYELNGSA